ncbi:aldehyde dehydrogenase family protein [Mycolicibacterium sp. XJ1819]
MTDSDHLLLINGKLAEADAGATFANVNPATEETLGTAPDASAADTDRAIAAARRAFDQTEWASDVELRKHCLRQLQSALESEREALRAILVAEAGAPVMSTHMVQLDNPLDDTLPWSLSSIDDFLRPRDLPDNEVLGVRNRRWVCKEAVGVVGAISPWNYPFEVLMGKLAPALATGNTVVVKASPETPWTATTVGRIVAEATDLPDGVVNVITSADGARGRQLVTDPRVDMISFTGSSATGKRIMADAANTLKRVFLELGGKNAQIILDDADLSATVPVVAMSLCFHAGQGCGMLSRLLVPRSRYAEAVDLATAGMQAVGYGDPTNPQFMMGPLISRAHRDRVLGFIDTGVKEGARVATGGGVPERFERGFFVEPTVLADVDNTMTVAREEIFGPVLVVIPFDDEDDAVRLANDSPYGLTCGVAAGSEERAIAVAERLRAGSACINGGQYYGPDAPFGGYKQSGFGRQGGLEGLEQYVQTKTFGAAIPS